MSIAKEPTTFQEGGWSTDGYTMVGNAIDFSNYVRFYLNDSTSISARITNSNNNIKRVLFYIDVNGEKKPNRQGRDIFQYNYYIKTSDTLSQGKFVPTAVFKDRDFLLNGDTYACNKNSTGAYCTALIMSDSWQIKDDYPW